MKNIAPTDAAALEAVETREWIDSIDYVIEQGDKGRTVRLLEALRARARQSGVREAFTSTTPYINTIAAGDEAPYPGDREVERRIKSLVRLNALATVVRANRESDGIGGQSARAQLAPDASRATAACSSPRPRKNSSQAASTAAGSFAHWP